MEDWCQDAKMSLGVEDTGDVAGQGELSEL